MKSVCIDEIVNYSGSKFRQDQVVHTSLQVGALKVGSYLMQSMRYAYIYGTR